MAQESGELPVTEYPDVAAFRKSLTVDTGMVLRRIIQDGETTDDRLARTVYSKGSDEQVNRSAVNRALSTLERVRIAGKPLLAREESPPREEVELSELGLRWATDRTPERRLLTLLGERSPRTIGELRSDPRFADGTCGNAIGTLKRAGAVAVEGGTVRLLQAELPEEAERVQHVVDLLKTYKVLDLNVTEGSPLDPKDPPLIRANAQGRGSSAQPFKIRSQRVYRIRLLLPSDTLRETTAQFFQRSVEAIDREIGVLTPDMLRDGSWKGRTFKPWNVSLTPAAPPIGRRHPYREYLDGVKRTLTSLGFVEMVGNLVETEFWNMDALFMPQFHPAREIHDVYGVRCADSVGGGAGRETTDPGFARASRVGDPATVEKVAAAHENGGGTGSTGWRYHFDLERAKHLILRSHGTALSARQLGALGKAGATSGKHFAVARCFRSDTIDATHAADFFQIEGIVFGPDTSFESLLGLLHLFGYEIARAKECRFVPAYFPFTEPSVEVHMKHPELGWMELGGAGIFRPELTKPLGIDVPVIAWGLGVDRMAMVALGVRDIRNLFHADLATLREMRITR